MNTTGKILIAVAAGAAAGVILGVLFAPESGKKTRNKISEEGKKLADNLTYRFRRGKEKLNDLKDEIKDTVKEKVGEFV